MADFWAWPPAGSPPSGGMSAFSTTVVPLSSGGAGTGFYYDPLLYLFSLTSGSSTTTQSITGTSYGFRDAMSDNAGGIYLLGMSGPLIDVSPSGTETITSTPNVFMEGVSMFSNAPYYLDVSGNIYNLSGTQVTSVNARPVGFSVDDENTGFVTAVPFFSGGSSLAVVANPSGSAHYIPLPAGVINPTCVLAVPS